MGNSFDIESFLVQFFSKHNCVVNKEVEGKITVQLTIPMDKALMNRPFYWQYIESTGNIGEPKSLTLITDLNKRTEGEWIHFGSPRLEQIYQYLKKTSKFIHQYEKLNVSQNTMLHPWLLTNICIMYEGIQKKEELLSIGLNLINGTFVFNMMERLDKLILSPNISDHCYTISPIIKLQSGYSRIENYLNSYVEAQDHHWANESLALLKEEMQMIHHFYQDSKDDAIKMKEIDSVKARLQPKINFEVMNGGIVYLRENIIK